MRITQDLYKTSVFILAFMVMAWSPFFGGPRLFSFLLALTGIGLLWKQRNAVWRQPAVRRLAIIFLLLGTPILLSLPGSYDFKGTLVVAGLLVLFFPMGVALVDVFRDTQLRERLALWITVLLIVWVIDGLVQFIFGRDLLGIPIYSARRVVGIFGDNTHFGIYLATLTPLLALTLLRHSRFLAAIAIILTAVVVMLTGIRHAWVMFVLACALMLFTYPFRHRVLALGTAAGIACLAIAVSFSPVVKTKLSKTVSSFEWSYEGIDNVLSRRLQLWDTATRMANAHPLTGVGVQAFRDAYQYYERKPSPYKKSIGAHVNHAHHAYFSVLGESGYVGLLGLLAIWVVIIRWYISIPRKQRRQTLPYAMCLLVAMFPLNAQPILYSGWWFPVLLLLTALMLAALDDIPAETDTIRQQPRNPRRDTEK